jgi:hypothetical protein
MEVSPDQNNNTGNANNNRRSRPSASGEFAPQGETRTERPMLTTSGSMGHFSRRMSTREFRTHGCLTTLIIFTENEDTVLGPPKLSFTSASRNAAKAGDNADKRGVQPDGELGERFPRQRNDRWTRDRDAEGGRDKSGYTNGRRVREDGEGWANTKGRKSLGQDDFDRGFGRNGDRDREKSNKDGDLDSTDTPRRTGGGARDKLDRDRWPRRDDNTTKDNEGSRFGATGAGGWRDREQNRDRNRDRDWTRGEHRVEENPEWMDTPTGKEKKKAHTAEEFQRWKESMRAKDNAAQEKEEPKVETPAASESIPTPLAAALASRSEATPSVTDPMASVGFFGNWAKDLTAVAAASPVEAGPKVNKEKKSKFMQMQMFKKADDPAPSPQPAVPTPTSLAPQENSNGTEDADKKGFQRILQMLESTHIAGTPGSQQTPSANENRVGGVSLMPTQQSPPPDERQESRLPRQQAARTDQQSLLENIISPKPSGPDIGATQARRGPMSPDNALYEQFGPPRQEPNRAADESPFAQPPPRNSSAQDVNLQALLNSRAQQEPNPAAKRERDFLLNLMQPTRATPPQPQPQPQPQPMSQPTPRQTMENPGMSYFDQVGSRPMQQPKGRTVPPGFEDQRFITDNEMLRQQHIRELSRQQEEALRAKNARVPMGFNPHHDDPAIASLQRRSTAGDIPRQMTNMGIPSQPVPDMQMFGGRGMPPTPQERPNILPPPGFGPLPGIRQPPGLTGMNGPQQMLPFQGGNPPMNPPPGLAPPPGAPGMRGMFPNGPGQNQMPPQAPPGFFPPPGFPPPMGMRGAEDPRMMMGGRPDFDHQYGGPGPRQGGRPPGMY